MNYGLYFPRGFISLIDELLSGYYDNYIRREDFFHLFYVIERTYKLNSRDNLVEIPSSIRLSFGRTKINGKMNWKFPHLVHLSVQEGILVETTHSNFIGNAHCKSYGYTLDFINKSLDKEIEFQFCNISEKTYNTIYKYYNPPEDPILRKHFNTIKLLDIDFKKAQEFANSLKNNRFLKTVREISIIYNKECPFVTQDIRTGRIFSSFNLMKKELRDFCSFNGELLDSLDLKSSQVYFLAHLLKRDNPDDEEVKRFYDLVTKEDIYKWFIAKWGGFQFMTDEEARKFTKELFFGYLYKDNRGTNSAQVMIKENFPVIYELVKNKKRKEELWLTLQKMEADVFIPVCNKWVEKGCLSVHDSLFFPSSLRGGIESDLKESFSFHSFNDYSLK